MNSENKRYHPGRGGYGKEVRAIVVDAVVNGKTPATLLSRRYGIHEDTIRKWVREFRRQKGFNYNLSQRPQSYPNEVRDKAVNAVLEESLTIHAAAKKFGVSHASVRNWIRQKKGQK